MQIPAFFITALSAAFLAACASPLTTPAPAAETPLPAGETPLPAVTESSPATCTAVSLLPTPGPTEASRFPAPSGSDWTIGPDDAAVTFMEYSDFQ